MRRNVRYALAVLFAINLLNFFDRQVLSAVAEPIRREWHLSDKALGLLQTAFTLVYAFAGMPFGRLADTRSRTRLLAAACAAWSVLTGFSGLATGFVSLFVLRLGVGVGEAACAPAANSLIADLVPGERRARSLSIFMLGLPAGLAASYLVSGALAQSYGWRAAFFVAGLPGLAVAAAVLLVDEPARAAGASRTGRPAPLRELLALPAFSWIVASGALHNFNMYAISSFLSPLLMRRHGLSVGDAGLYSTLIYGVAGAIGLYAGGAVSDRMKGRREDGRLLLTAVATLVSVPLVLLALQRPAGDPITFAFWMALAVLAMYVYYGSIYAAIQDVVPRDLRGTALAAYFLAMYTLGASLGPLVTGALSDGLTGHAARAAQSSDLEAFRAEGLLGALHVVPLFGVLLSAVLFAAARAVRNAPAERPA